MLNNAKKKHQSHLSNFNVLKHLRELQGETKANSFDVRRFSSIPSQCLIILIIFDFDREIKPSKARTILLFCSRDLPLYQLCQPRINIRFAKTQVSVDLQHRQWVILHRALTCAGFAHRVHLSLRHFQQRRNLCDG
jgi:hypothetical protein